MGHALTHVGTDLHNANEEVQRAVEFMYAQLRCSKTTKTNREPADPHPGWLKAWRDARKDWKAAADQPGAGELDTPACKEAEAREARLAERLATTPAQTAEGLAAQVQFMIEDLGDQWRNSSAYSDVLARNMDATAARIAAEPINAGDPR